MNFNLVMGSSWIGGTNDVRKKRRALDSGPPFTCSVTLNKLVNSMSSLFLCCEIIAILRL